MKKVIRIMDAYGQKKDIPIKEYFDIKKGDEIYVEYCILEVISVVHDIEEETVYYRCQNKE
jgi:hypothetical protein